MTVDEDLADRLERALAEASHLRGVELEHVGGNPLAIEHRQFGGLPARLVGTDLAYYRYFSGPLSTLSSADRSIVSELVDWYAQRNAPCFVRLSPLYASPDLLQGLSAAGLAQTGFMSVLYGKPAMLTAPPGQVSVDELVDGQRNIFTELWTVDAPSAERALRQRLAQAEFAHWRCYVAFVDGRPAAHAALFISRQTRTGVLAATATRPEHRRQGCQTALVARRIADAARAGCDLVAVEATPGSPSQRNLERMGLRLAYTRVVWTRA